MALEPLFEISPRTSGWPEGWIIGSGDPTIGEVDADTSGIIRSAGRFV